jgi:hypothetical protein
VGDNLDEAIFAVGKKPIEGGTGDLGADNHLADGQRLIAITCADIDEGRQYPPAL